MAELLQTLIDASETAAAVARSCCAKSSEDVLLVAEKGEGEANTRFDKDFKTIADVLAQESAKTLITSRFPNLQKYVRGEECSEIGGVNITLQPCLEDTTKLLELLVPSKMARRMATAAHTNKFHKICTLPKNLPIIDINDLGIWIDPIDATAEFISGVCGETSIDKGLSCVTVLLGAYLRSTGEPVIGVINQPFYNNGEGRIIWGVNYQDTKEWSKNTSVSSTKTILMSGAENPEIVEKFKHANWNVISVPGAGHKLLKVALGEAAAYIVTKGTTFRWDTCGPHSILRAKGGELLSYKTHVPITYNDSEDVNTQQYCNSEGIIAYSEASVLEEIKYILK